MLGPAGLRALLPACPRRSNAASSFAVTVTVVPDDYASWNATSHQRVVQGRSARSPRSEDLAGFRS